ncbi:MAG: cyanophycinase [Chitinophagales bacterium]|nr:cyanophycinase [Chitinophagales bacterium]MDW8428873.1 cyanophycinase [Chitinophagales bacterium]
MNTTGSSISDIVNNLFSLLLGLGLSVGTVLQPGCTPPADQPEAVPPYGTLFIIGGGEREDSLMQRMVNATRWSNGDFVTVVTLPSQWDSTFFYISSQLQRLTGKRCVLFDSAAVRNERKLDTLARSGIIFISGGDQSRMMDLIAGTPVRNLIANAYRNGATVGGTSAGASVMSRIMITGNQLLDTFYRPTFPVLKSNNLETREGLGLLDSVIVDQHFIVRSRYNRMLTAVMEFPTYQCIGIDENTALLVRGRTATVIGEAQVVVLQQPVRVRQNSKGFLALDDVKFSVYLSGESFFIKQ